MILLKRPELGFGKERRGSGLRLRFSNTFNRISAQERRMSAGASIMQGLSVMGHDPRAHYKIRVHAGN